MEIIIGLVPKMNPQGPKLPQKAGTFIEAQMLHVRPPRKGIAGPSGRERRTKQATDPRKGRVITIMVPDSSLLPRDLETARYEVTIRLVRRQSIKQDPG